MPEWKRLREVTSSGWYYLRWPDGKGWTMILVDRKPEQPIWVRIPAFQHPKLLSDCGEEASNSDIIMLTPDALPAPRKLEEAVPEQLMMFAGDERAAA